MVTKTVTWLLMLIVTFDLLAQETPTPPEIGKAAPQLVVSKALQGPMADSVSWTKTKGKAAILDFWATWCGPCVGSIPHFNALADKFKNRRVQFIAISDEEEWRVKRLLKLRPFSPHIWVGLDAHRATFTAYGVQALPHIVLVDANGTIRGRTFSPENINEQVVENLLAGEVTQLARNEVDPAEEAFRSGRQPPLLEVRIVPASKSWSMRVRRESLEASSMSLTDLVAFAFGVSPARLVTDSPLAETRYGVFVKVPKEQSDSMRPLLQQALTAGFGMQIHRETKDVGVLVLSANKVDADLLRPSEKEAVILSDKGQITSRGASMSFLAKVIESSVGRIIVDETNLQGPYDFALYWNAEEPDSIVPAIQEQLGLALIPGNRRVEVLVFDTSADAAK